MYLKSRSIGTFEEYLLNVKIENIGAVKPNVKHTGILRDKIERCSNCLLHYSEQD